MSIYFVRIALAAALLAMLHGCAVYQKYGYGWAAKSKLPQTRATELQLPSQAPSISQRFLPVEPGTGREHRGFDILVPRRSPVLAAAGGVVAAVRLSILFGRQVFVNHGRSANGYRIQTRYFHMNEQLVRKDERVHRGQLLGYSGASGLAGVYPHLHFEVHRLSDDDPPIAAGFLDPQLFWSAGAGMVTCYDREHEFDDLPVRLTYPAPCLGIHWQ